MGLKGGEQAVGERLPVEAIEELPHMLTVPEVKEFLRIGRAQAYRLVREEDLAIRVGERTLRVPRQRFLEFLRDRTIQRDSER